MRDWLDSVLAGPAVLGLTGALTPVVLGMSLKGPRRVDGLLHYWGRRCMQLTGTRVRVEGLEHVPQGPCIMVANHQSHFDVPLLFAHIRKHVRFIAKRELFRIPVFGQALRLSGNVEVDRRGGQSDRDTLGRAIPVVQAGTTILFFPEGTRSQDGALRPFKKGASVLALLAQVPVLPLAVAGTRHILPKSSRTVRHGCPVGLVVGRPIPTEGLTLEARDALTQQCHTTVASLLVQAEALAQETH
jgi:1-acyl-sn-glycerol-3-phosphate acyltransferase